MKEFEIIKYNGIKVKLVCYDFLPDKIIAVSTDIYKKLKEKNEPHRQTQSKRS